MARNPRRPPPRPQIRVGLLLYRDQIDSLDALAERLESGDFPIIYSRAALIRRAVDRFLQTDEPAPARRDATRSLQRIGIILYRDQVEAMDDMAQPQSIGRRLPKNGSRTAFVRTAIDMFIAADRRSPFDPTRPMRTNT